MPLDNWKYSINTLCKYSQDSLKNQCLNARTWRLIWKKNDNDCYKATYSLDRKNGDRGQKKLVRRKYWKANEAYSFIS